MFGCGVSILQNMAGSSNIFVVLCHWITGGKTEPRIFIFNDCNNSGGES